MEDLVAEVSAISMAVFRLKNLSDKQVCSLESSLSNQKLLEHPI